MSHPVTAEISAIQATAYGDETPRPQDLPFVASRGKGRSHCYWQPKRANSFEEDCAIGTYYAVEALNYMRLNPNVDLLNHVARDMQEPIGSDVVELMFWRTIAIPAKGHQIMSAQGVTLTLGKDTAELLQRYQELLWRDGPLTDTEQAEFDRLAPSICARLALHVTTVSTHSSQFFTPK